MNLYCLYINLTGMVIGLTIFWIIDYLFFQNEKKKQKQLKTTLITIGPDSTLTLLQILEKLDHVLEKNETIIITDPLIVQRNELRQQIHSKCETIGIKSKSVKPSGTTGVYMIITPEPTFVTNNLTYEELAQFCRYAKLPIDKKVLASSDIFWYKMKVLDDFHKEHGKPYSASPIELFDLFLEIKDEATKNGVSLSGYINNIETKILDYFKHNESYKKFNTEDITNKNKNKCKITDSTQGNMQGTNPYKIGVDEFHGISIDIISANFTMLRLYDPNIVDNTNNWSEFMLKFSQLKFFGLAKVFRQEVLGKLNTKRIASKEKEILRSIVEPLREAGIQVDGNINTDEIIISTTKQDAIKDYATIKEVLDSLPNPEIWRVDIFRTKPLLKYPTSGFYPFVRDTHIIQDKDTTSKQSKQAKQKVWTEFCCMPKVYATQAIKYWKGEEIEENDLVFSDEYGNIHTFSYPLFK